ncbi:MAG: DUF1810 family protein [Gammaproteobacteria bacterium]|nr:DUF1810 family protein [Gammaproteobacteria bacterium]
MTDNFNLERFIEAQHQMYDDVINELKNGQKRSHWMWFIFPQVKGLGNSAIAQKYAINSEGEAYAYLSHPILGKRLRECTKLVVDLTGKTANKIFGYPDVLKFKSSMTLFKHVATDAELFQKAIDKYFNGTEDQLTIDILCKQIQ